ncbi:antichymotrypsin-2-like isoform X2 [Photinus pyralis]|uniref:Serpin domain-containing protein n=1 Tax=Photinus pyralis TaxID=7054 RepID=A0A1Y1K9R6_PHOPY|nr:antichymotrypsin-2-like isoform X2 [Photinus pyralis]
MKFFLLLILGAAVAYANNDLLKEFSDGNRIFSANVYKEMKKTNSGNFLVCPLSVDVVLALVHAGARGETAKQLSAGLQLPEDHQKVQAIFKELSPKLRGNEHYTLSSANKVYLAEGFKVSDEFNSVAVNVFQSEIENINFAQSKASANEMNKWVEEKTHDKIKNLIKEDDLSEDTIAVLINALYFKGSWVKQFSEYGTRKQPFYVTKENQVDVDMMEITEFYNYYEDSTLNAKFLEMPYKGEDISMTFVLPNDVDGLGALEDKIEAALATPKYTNERVHVQLPKFKIESTIQFIPILQKLGVKDLFENNADLSGIGANKQNLTVTKVIQKAFIEVEEKGTTAAAATAVVAVLTSIQLSPKKLLEFEANRPFLFYLTHRKLNTLVFMGRVSNPAY